MNLIEKTRLRLIKNGKKIINLSSGNANENGIFFPEKILREAATAFLARPAYRPDPKGLLTARKGVCGYYKKRGLQIKPDQILLTSGTSESYFHLFKHLAPNCGEILFPVPTYPLFEEIARLSGTKVGFYKLNPADGWQIDLEDLEKNISAKTRAVVLVSPSNPTGSVLSKATIEKVIELAARHSLAVISDEVFSEFMFDSRLFPRAAEIALQNPQTKNTSVFTLNGASKTYALPGLKLGWIVVTGGTPRSATTGSIADHIDSLERGIDALLCTNQIAQSALPIIIAKGEPFIKKFQQYIEKNRRLAVALLKKNPKIFFHRPEGGFYIFAKIEGLKARGRKGRKHPPTDERFVIELMKKHHIFAHPGYFYDYDSELYILISLLIPPRLIKSSLTKIVDLVKMM
jgi:hypothetical protein